MSLPLQYMRQFQQKAKRQQLPGMEPALARVTAALDAAALETGPATRRALQEIDTHNAQPGSSGKRRGAKLTAQKMQQTASAAVASDTAADHMARMLLQVTLCLYIVAYCNLVLSSAVSWTQVGWKFTRIGNCPPDCRRKMN